jgi:hypothetical protein
MSQRFRKSYKGYLIDHHSPDPPVITFEKLDVAEWERMFKLARIDNYLLYCKDHWGSAYYDTAVGKKHPALKTDWIREVSDMLKRNNIEFIAYYSVGFDAYAAATHPDWASRTETGEVQRVGQKWPYVCTETAYRDYCKAQLREIVAGYEPDAVFLDIVSFPLCYCPVCQERFKSRYGFDIPKGDEKAAHWRELTDWQHNHLEYGALTDLADEVREVNADVAVAINGGHAHLCKNLLDYMDFTYAEPWAGNFVSAGFARGTGYCPVIGPGGVSQVFDPQKETIFVSEAANIAAQGCRVFMFSGSQHPDGRLDEQEFRSLGAAYGEIDRVMPFLKNREPITSIAVGYSEASRLWMNDAGYMDGLAGALDLAYQTNLPVDTLPEWEMTIDVLQDFQAVILPNMACMADDVAQALREYVKGGGTLISTHRTGLLNQDGEERGNFALNDVFGLEFGRINDQYITNPWGSFLKRNDDSIWKSTQDTQLACSAPFIETTVSAGETWATHILPVVALSENSWVNWWSPPPQEETAFPAVQVNPFGRGQSIYLSFDFFKMARTGFNWPQSFLRGLLGKLVPQPKIAVRTSAPASLGTTFFWQAKKKRAVVHILNHTLQATGGDVVKVPAGTLFVSRELGKPKRASIAYPKERGLSIVKTGDGYEISLPRVAVHSVVTVEL